MMCDVAAEHACWEIDQIVPESQTRLFSNAWTWTTDNTNNSIRARINFEKDNGLFWTTSGTQDSNDQVTEQVRIHIAWNCEFGAKYKVYSDHWIHGRGLARLEGTPSTVCGNPPPVTG